jgi:hypothetical protein
MAGQMHEHAGDFKEWWTVCSHQVTHAINNFSACSRRDSSLKRCYEIIGGGHLNMKTQIPNINMVRSAWRRVKKNIKDAIIRDLKPVKDVKGGGVTGKSKLPTGEGTTGTTRGH